VYFVITALWIFAIIRLVMAALLELHPIQSREQWFNLTTDPDPIAPSFQFQIIEEHT
jgi:hypothetical protein